MSPRLEPEERRTHLTSHQGRKIKNAVKFRCEKDGKKHPARHLFVHHINPVKSRGGNEEPNLVVLCIACHTSAESNIRGYGKAALKKIVENRKPKVREELKEILKP